MPQSLQVPVRSIPLRVCLLVVLTVALLISLSLFLLSTQGTLRLGGGGGTDPNGVQLAHRWTPTVSQMVR